MQTIDLKRLRLYPGARVLDLGCGRGRHAHALYQAAQVHVWGMDLDLASARESARGFQLFRGGGDHRGLSWTMLSGDCLHLPFATGSFDHLICSEVLEHLPNYHAALCEIRRVLTPDGILALSVPSFGPERICWALSREYQHDPGGHLRIFKTGPLKLEVQRLGFESLGGHHAHALHSPYWWLKCFQWSRRETWAPIRWYHRFLVWEMNKKSGPIRFLERICNPFLGKSVVLYFQKVVHRRGHK